MPDWKSREIRDALQEKGFRITRTTSHEFYLLFDGDVATGIRVMVSHGARKVSQGDRAFDGMRRQMFLTTGELRRFISCELSGDEYLRMMRDADRL